MHASLKAVLRMHFGFLNDEHSQFGSSALQHEKPYLPHRIPEFLLVYEKSQRPICWRELTE